MYVCVCLRSKQHKWPDIYLRRDGRDVISLWFEQMRECQTCKVRAKVEAL